MDHRAGRCKCCDPWNSRVLHQSCKCHSFPSGPPGDGLQFIHPAPEGVKYKEGVANEDDVISFDSWCTQQISTTPQFQYWHTALQLELLLLIFLKSLRAADFELYVDALSNMLPWFFAMNHSNYARWLPVHLRDMRSLDQMVPDVAAEFKKGLFTVNKTAK